MCEINNIAEVEAELHIEVALEQQVCEAQVMANILFLFGCLIFALCFQISTFECILMYRKC